MTKETKIKAFELLESIREEFTEDIPESILIEIKGHSKIELSISFLDENQIIEEVFSKPSEEEKEEGTKPVGFKIETQE